MPAPKDSSPSLRKKKSYAVVTLTDSVTRKRTDIVCGKFGTAESRKEYRRILDEWETAGRRLPEQKCAAPDLTVVELVAQFWDFAETYYRDPDGAKSLTLENYKFAIRPLVASYGDTPANSFSPKCLKEVRQRMIDSGLARSNINHRVGKIRRVFRWAVEEELIPVTVHQALVAVENLKQGRSEARETKPVRPVARAVVDQTILHAPSVVADMVRLQLETGMRPGELVIMRACDIDMTGKVWLYRPRRHKTEHHGHQRIVPIGPRAQDIVKRYLRTDLEAFLFRPDVALRERAKRMRQDRKTPLWPSHLKAKERQRVKSPRRKPGDRYAVGSYATAVARACDLAFPPPDHLGPKMLPTKKMETKKAWMARLTDDQKAELRQWRKAHHWHPHQLRHTRALELKREVGLDVARAVLGHRGVQVTEMYAGIDVAKGAEAMAKLGSPVQFSGNVNATGKSCEVHVYSPDVKTFLRMSGSLPVEITITYPQ